ncbi:MAG: hypothetical protein ACRDT1_12270, partial [Micromonosporaceae bacterium]
RRTRQARAVRAGLAAVLPGDASAPTGKADSPAWVPAAGKVTCTGAWAVSDSYGDQTQYIATFSYADPETGGPEHAVSCLVDHNLGFVKNVSIGVPAEQVVSSWQQEAEQDDDIHIEPVAPGQLRATVRSYLSRTDELPEPPEGTYPEERAFALGRLAVLPDSGEAPRPTLSDEERDVVVTNFLNSPEVAGLSGSAPTHIVAWCARGAVDFAVDDNAGDPLRWSPTAVEFMLLRWAPEQLSGRHEAAPWLPEVLDAFVAYAGRVKGQSATALAATRDMVTECAAAYTDEISGDSLGEPVTDVLARMVADGVDPMDEEQVLAWVLADRERRDEG